MFKKKQQKQSLQSAAPAEHSERDEALFQALGRSRKAKRRKVIRTVVIILVLLAVILVVGVSILQRRVREQFAGSGAEVISEKAHRGSISTVVSGSGMLLNVDTQTVSVPSGVEVTQILVAYGDTVEEGGLLALVDMASVRSAMSDLQTQIDDLDDQIADAEDDKVGTYVSAGVPGRVKIIYAEKDTLVEDAMVEHGALAVISLDGYMAVDVETELLTEGDGVRVTLSDGSETEGTVKSVIAGTATVLVTDNGPAYDEEVTVLTADGLEAGAGRLYIHDPLRVTGYAGKVRSVSVKQDQQVYASTTLFVLTDTTTRASYDALLRSRGELEETLLELLRLQRYGGLTAPISGGIYSVADLDSEDDTEILDIVTISPDVSMSVTISVDESDILSLELGQTADVTVRSIGDTVLTGTVTEIDKTDTSGAYTAVITLDKVEGMIPGMTASVDVRIEGVDDAVLIPAEALHQTSTGYYVYTSYDETTETFGGKVDVIPGLSNSEYVQIKSGLEEGDTVYYTEEEDFFSSMGFGNMPGGGMPSGGGSGGMPSGGGMPSDGNGGGRPSGGGSGMPDFGGMPSGGGMPGGWG